MQNVAFFVITIFMAQSFAPLEIGNTPVLRDLFGPLAAVNENSIITNAQDSDTANQSDSLELDPHARTEKQKLLSILKKDGPEAAINATLHALYEGKITDIEIAYDIADAIYAKGYHDKAKAFSQNLEIKSIDPAIAEAELQKQREEEQRLEEENRIHLAQAPNIWTYG